MYNAEVQIGQDGPVTTITLNRPAQRNAIGLSGWRALKMGIEAADNDTGCRVVILRGAAGNFGAGADISEFDSVFAQTGTTVAYFDSMEATMRAFERAQKPVIAAVEGLCIGACVALALACDIRFANAESLFAITPAKLGIAYPYGDISRVVSAVGPGVAKSLLFTGNRVSADTALRLGLIDHIAPAGKFEEMLSKLVSDIISASHFTISATKAAVRSISQGAGPQDAGYPERLTAAVSGEDFKEGVSAFREKRVPHFTFSTPS